MRERVLLVRDGQVVATIDLAETGDPLESRGGAEVLSRLRVALADARRASARLPAGRR
jgi:hypothetical protein